MAKTNNEIGLPSDVVVGLGDAKKPKKHQLRRMVRSGRPTTNITYFVTLATHRRLKEYAFANNTSLQQVMDEAVDLLFTSKDEPQIEKATK